MKNHYKMWLGKALLALALVTPALAASAGAPSDLYMFGGPAGWEKTRLLHYSSKDGNVFKFENVTFSDELNFRFKSNQNNDNNGFYGTTGIDGEAVLVGTGMQIGDGHWNNWKMPETGKYNIEVNFDTWEMTATKVETIKSTFVLKALDENGEAQSIDFSTTDYKTYTATFDLPTDQRFKIVRDGGTYYSTSEQSFDKLRDGVTYTLQDGGSYIQFTNVKKDVTITLTWDGVNAKVVFSGLGNTDNTDMYLTYSQNGQKKEVEMEKLGDVYYIRNHYMPKNGTTNDADKQMCFFQFEDSDGFTYHTTNKNSSNQDDNFWFNDRGAQDKCATTGSKTWAANGDRNWNITINLKTMKVTAEPYNSGEYYLVGDCNKWLNDGTYTLNNEAKTTVPYGYVSYKDGNKVHGDKEDWKFAASTSQKYAAADGWLSLSVEKVWGQFTIYNGPFKNEAATGKANVVDWSNNIRGQWSHVEPRTLNDDDNQPVNAHYFNKPLTQDAVMDLRLGGRGNAYIDHNFYDNATLYFNPILGQVAIEGNPRDIYFYYHHNDDTASENLTLLLNKESMNTTNYSIGGTEYKEDESHNLHIPLTLVNEPRIDPESGIDYDNYWTCKIPNGLELPAGQLFTISVENAKGVASTYWATIQGKNVKILDSVKVFVEIPSNNKSDIKSISYRVYGYAKDGASVKVLDGDTETAAEAQDNIGWITLEKGSYESAPSFGSLNHTWVSDTPKVSNAPRKATTQSDSKIVAYAHPEKEVHSANAFKFVQFKIEYHNYVVPDPEQGENENYGAVTHYVPETFVTERPERDAYMQANQNEEPSWVLYGNHKVYRGAGVTTAVKNIEAEDAESLNAPEEYFNLQGIRVAEPTHGIFIKRQGKKVTKVIL